MSEHHIPLSLDGDKVTDVGRAPRLDPNESAERTANGDKLLRGVPQAPRSGLEIISFTQSTRDDRCLEVWFYRKVTDADRAALLEAVNRYSATPRDLSALEGEAYDRGYQQGKLDAAPVPHPSEESVDARTLPWHHAREEMARAFANSLFEQDKIEVAWSEMSEEEKGAYLIAAASLVHLGSNKSEVTREPYKTLQWIADQRWDENADLDSICTAAEKAISASANAPRPFHGAECSSYPNCNGGCGLGCTKEMERLHAPGASPSKGSSDV